MNDKRLHLIDNSKNRDSAHVHKTRVQVFIPGTDICIFEGSNKVIIPGSIFTVAKHFNITPPIRTTSYNTALGLENTILEDPGVPGIRREETVVLFAAGIGGCGVQGDQVYEVDYKKWITPEELVPFRYPLLVDDISDDLRSTYYGRKIINDRVAYYFKSFETDPTLTIQYKDGTPVSENVFTSTKTDEIETYVELRLKITKEECREWFVQNGGINQAKVNTISLLTAWPRNIDGIVYYQDIRPLTKINIPNEYLIDLEKGMDIIYHIYY